MIDLTMIGAAGRHRNPGVERDGGADGFGGVGSSSPCSRRPSARHRFAISERFLGIVFLSVNDAFTVRVLVPPATCGFDTSIRACLPRTVH